MVIPVLGFYLYIFIGVSRLGLRLGLGLGWRCCPSPTYIRVIHEISHGQFTHEIDCMWPLHFKHSHWWKRRSWSKFASCLRDQRSMWMQDGCKVYMDSCMVSNGLCFMVTWTILKNHRPPLLPPETPRCTTRNQGPLDTKAWQGGPPVWNISTCSKIFGRAQVFGGNSHKNCVF